MPSSGWVSTVASVVAWGSALPQPVSTGSSIAKHSNKQIIAKNGQEAVSKYKVIKNDEISKLEIVIIHGRKHQIRVHMNYLGHPIVGDRMYGKDDGESLKLHFKKITFFHPFKHKKIMIECEERF